MFGLLVQFFMNDETRSSPPPLSLTTTPLCLQKLLADKLNQGDDTLLVTLRLIAGACLSNTERKVALYWSAEGFTKLHFESDTVDATNVANQTVHGRRARD